MFATQPRAPAERLAGILDMLCRAVADHGGRKLLAVPLVLLVWGRLRRLSTRILRLAAKIAVPQPGGFYGGWVTSWVTGPFKGGPGTHGW